ncbi:NAD(P)-binding protein [Patellaria atrata CBS 101060]|uniref:NAD(P)-binding protein n=1 Tax=Patellaria atrata CBS 101060 TaxID=1346257 RepID=A0A9P4S7R1_9PEZI|nr:NAD(P)-binding protein [Patellaria atrata CBS 101060]
MDSSERPYYLVTGATGFIGAHVVDELLARGFKVRATTRSPKKGEFLRQARSSYSSRLDIVQIKDFSEAASLENVVKDIDGVIHVASPFTYDILDNEKELVLPAIAGVTSILEASLSNPKVKRVVITSSFAAVLDIGKKSSPRYKYTATDWNPLSYEESVNEKTSAVVAYRGSKKFAELKAWKFIKERKPSFDIVTLCPPMTFGPVAHPVESLHVLNESNAMLWKTASGEQLPVARVPFWVDVRDLACAHVEAMLKHDVGNTRFTVASPEKFSYQLVTDIVAEEFEWGKDRVAKSDERQQIDDNHDLDGETAANALGITYRTFRQTVKDFISQAVEMEKKAC